MIKQLFFGFTILFVIFESIFCITEKAEVKTGTTIEKTIYKKINKGIYPNKEKDVYIDGLFLLSYFLKHREHGLVVLTPDEQDFMGDLIGQFGLALKQGTPIEFLINDKCYDEGILEFGEKQTIALNTELLATADKYEVGKDFQLKKLNKEKEIGNFIHLYGDNFIHLGGSVAKGKVFHTDAISKEEIMYLLKYLALAFEQFGALFHKTTDLEQVTKSMCQELIRYTNVIETNDNKGALFGTDLFKLLMKKQKLLSSAYLVAPIHAAVLGYLVVSSL